MEGSAKVSELNKEALARSWQTNRVPQMLEVGGDALLGMLKDLGQLFNPRSGHIHYIKWILEKNS